MAKDIVPIKVKIGLRPNGHADHPDWTLLPCAGSGTKTQKEQNLRAHMFAGWFYDKTSGHQDDTPGSELGVQYGMLGVSNTFAQEALAMFPSLITVLSDAQAQTFYDTKAMAHVSENRANNDLLQALNAELQLRESLGQTTEVTALKAKIAKALDPDDPEPGLKRNPTKTWVGIKNKMGLNAVAIT
jgi:hypothetical protein